MALIELPWTPAGACTRAGEAGPGCGGERKEKSQVGYIRLATRFMWKLGKPDFRCHPRLGLCKAVKPGMTVERQRKSWMPA